MHSNQFRYLNTAVADDAVQLYEVKLDDAYMRIDFSGTTLIPYPVKFWEETLNTTIRPQMIKLVHEDPDTLLRVDVNNGNVRRINVSEIGLTPNANQIETHMKDEPKAVNEMISFIHNDSLQLLPKTLFISPIKWKFLMRSAMRAKNIMIVGPTGSGKTKAAKTVAESLNRPFFYFNLGATQDPRSTLIGNTHFRKDEGTIFAQSLFVQAIQTENAVILLDEITRAHPDAWNILMTALDDGQRYIRLDEAIDSATIRVANGVSFIGTANIGTEYTATRALDRALTDRFVLLEMDMLSKEEEVKLLLSMYPDWDTALINDIAEIARLIRQEYRNDASKLTTTISTRTVVEMAGLAVDGFSISEIAEICIYPFFDASGGVDSERTFVKQIVQKILPMESSADGTPMPW